MLKFRKLFNVKIISLIVNISFLFTTSLYAYPDALNDNRDTLRVPSGFVKESQRGKHVEGLSNTLDNLKASEELEALYNPDVELSNRMIALMAAQAVAQRQEKDKNLSQKEQDRKLANIERYFFNKPFRKQLNSPIEIRRDIETRAAYVHYEGVYLSIKDGEIHWSDEGKFSSENTQLVSIIRREEERKEIARIRGRTVTGQENVAIAEAHGVGEGPVGSYSFGEIRQKVKILQEGGFNRAERKLLIKSGIAGASRGSDRTKGRLGASNEKKSKLDQNDLARVIAENETQYESDWHSWQKGMIENHAIEKIPVDFSSQDENSALITRALSDIRDMAYEFPGYAEAIDLIDRYIINKKERFPIVLFKSDDTLASRLIDRFHFRQVVLIDPDTGTIYIDYDFWQSAIIGKIEIELKERRAYLRIVALLATCATYLEYLSELPEDESFTRIHESQMKRVGDLYVFKNFNLILNKAVSEFVTVGPELRESKWFIEAIRTRAPPFRALLFWIREKTLLSNIYYWLRSKRLLSNTVHFFEDRSNRGAFENIDRFKIYSLLAYLSDVLGERKRREIKGFKEPVEDLFRELNYLLALMSQCVYLRSMSPGSPMGYSGDYRKVVMDQVDVVGMSQLVVQLQDVLEDDVEALDMDQLKTKVDIYKDVFFNLCFYITDKVADTSYQTPLCGGFSIFRNHAVDTRYGDTSSEIGLYEKLEKDLKAGENRTHYVWGMGGGADVLSTVKRWKELMSFYEQIKHKQEQVDQSCGRLETIVITSCEKRMGYVDPSKNYARWLTEQNPLYVSERDVLSIKEFEDLWNKGGLSISEEEYLRLLEDAEDGYVRVGVFRRREPGIIRKEELYGFIDVGYGRVVKEAARDLDKALKEVVTEGINIIDIGNANVMIEIDTRVENAYESLDRVLEELRTRGIEIEDIEFGCIVKVTSDIQVKGAVRKLDEAYVLEELRDAGIDIPIYMVTLGDTLSVTASALQNLIQSTKLRGSTVSFENYECGGDAIAGMHAGNKETIVSPTAERTALKVVRSLVALNPEILAFFTLSGLGNDFESYFKWINEIFRHLLKTGVIVEIVAPWSQGVYEGARLAERVSGRVTSYANKRSLAQITSWTTINSIYAFLRFIDHHSALRKVFSVFLGVLFSERTTMNMFRLFVGYAKEGRITKRGDFHANISFAQKGEISKYTFVMPFRAFEKACDTREIGEDGTIELLSAGLFSSREIHAFEEILSIRNSSSQGLLTIRDIDRVYERIGVTTEKGRINIGRYPSEVYLPYSVDQVLPVAKRSSPYDEIEYATLMAKEGIEKPEVFVRAINNLLDNGVDRIRVIAENKTQMEELWRVIDLEKARELETRGVKFSIPSKTALDRLQRARTNYRYQETNIFNIEGMAVFNIDKNVYGYRKLRDAIEGGV